MYRNIIIGTPLSIDPTTLHHATLVLEARGQGMYQVRKDRVNNELGLINESEAHDLILRHVGRPVVPAYHQMQQEVE